MVPCRCRAVSSSAKVLTANVGVAIQNGRRTVGNATSPTVDDSNPVNANMPKYMTTHQNAARVNDAPRAASVQPITPNMIVSNTG